MERQTKMRHLDMLRLVGLMGLFLCSALFMIPLIIWRRLRAKPGVDPMADL